MPNEVGTLPALPPDSCLRGQQVGWRWGCSLVGDGDRLSGDSLRAADALGCVAWEGNWGQVADSSEESSSYLRMPRGEKAGQRLPSLFRRWSGALGQNRLWASFPRTSRLTLGRQEEWPLEGGGEQVPGMKGNVDHSRQGDWDGTNGTVRGCLVGSSLPSASSEHPYQDGHKGSTCKGLGLHLHRWAVWQQLGLKGGPW